MKFILLVFLVITPAFSETVQDDYNFFISSLKVANELLNTNFPEPLKIAEARSHFAQLNAYSEDRIKKLITYIFQLKSKSYELIHQVDLLYRHASDSLRQSETLVSIGTIPFLEKIGIIESNSPFRQYYLDSAEKQREELRNIRTLSGRATQITVRLKTWVNRFRAVVFSVHAVATGALMYYGYTDWLDTILKNWSAGSLTALTGSTVASSLIGLRSYWPWLREKSIGTLFSSQYEQLIGALGDLIKIAPAYGYDFIRGLAIPNAEMAKTAIELAAVEALKRNDTQQSTQTLIELTVIYLEKGYLDRAEKILETLIERDAQNGNKYQVNDLATSIQSAILHKRSFENELAKFKRKFLIKRVAWTVAGITGIGAATHFVQPDAVNLMRIITMQVVGIIGFGKFFSWLWFHHPQGVLLEHFGESQQNLENAFLQVLKTSPATIDFIAGIASDNKKTHPFIRQAAYSALRDCEHPMVAEAFSKLALNNIIEKGKASETEQILGVAIAKKFECTERLTRYK
jgi:tetratricopeptide (TPR) repeat protein